VGGVEMAIDIGAEKILVAEKGDDKIAVEIKSFISASEISEFHNALG
jgi:XisH protein